MSTAHALKIVNMETRLKIKLSKNAIFKAILHILSSYVDKGDIIFVLKVKMVSRDPRTGDWYGSKWDACVYSFQIKEFCALESKLFAYSLLLLLFVIEVQSKSFIYFGR